MPEEARRVLDLLELSDCSDEPPDGSAGNGTLVLCKSCIRSFPLSHLSSS